MFNINLFIKNIFRNLGFNITRINKFGTNPYCDMTSKVTNESPIIFDVGANIGQTVDAFRLYFPKATIHSFEPSPSTFEMLKQNTENLDNVKTWNTGLGSIIGQTTFFENSKSSMSSYLKLDKEGWGVEKETIAQITTIDAFCHEQQIDIIDILKIDTQGFELEVLKGAEQMLAKNGIGLIYCEVTFSEMYKERPTLGDIYNFLEERGYKLVSIYKIFYKYHLAGWSDMLFIHKDYIQSSINK